MKTLLTVYFALIFISALSGCSGYKTPSMSGDPSGMSADTLCYRYAYAKHDTVLADEVKRRGLDCERILAAQSRP